MMPKSDPEARSATSANNNDAATSVKLFLSSIAEPNYFANRLVAGYSATLLGRCQNGSSPPLNLDHRSFKVERLSKANRIARIKKRKTIFDSFQPTISKW